MMRRTPGARRKHGQEATTWHKIVCGFEGIGAKSGLYCAEYRLYGLASYGTSVQKFVDALNPLPDFLIQLRFQL